MAQNHPLHSDDARGSGPLQEFVDEAHEVTEEERTRPRYGRPQRSPAQPEPPQGTTEWDANAN